MILLSTLKKISYILFTICVILATVLISFGIYMFFNYKPHEVIFFTCVAYITMGVLTYTVFIILCIGACRESVCCSITFVIVVLMAMIIQATMVYYLVTEASLITSNLANVLDEAWEEDLSSPGVMSIYESAFNCCGRASPQDYIVRDYLPATCFINGNDTIPENLIATGCRIKVENFFAELLFIFNIIACILIIFEMIVVLFSCWLCNTIRSERRRMPFYT